MPRIYLNVAGSLERAVRPFAADPPVPRQARPEPVQDDGAAVLEWSCKTNVETATIDGLGFKVSWPATHTETSRVTHVNRIENPDDPGQFVDVEVIDDISFRGDKGRTRFKLDN